MKKEENTITKYNIVEILSILFLVLSSGGNVFVRNIMYLIFACFALFVKVRKLKITNVKIFFVLYIYIFINSVVINTCPTDYYELVILFLRLCCCTIIASCISENNFKHIFTNIIIFLAVLSLVCNIMVYAGIKLPFFQTKEFYGTFYHVISPGADMSAIKNRGIFTEHGLFQMYLNLALVFLWGCDDIPLLRKRIYFCILTITIITTKSRMGYMIYLLVLLYYFVDGNGIFIEIKQLGEKKKSVLFALLCGLIVCAEFMIGGAWAYISGSYSYASRRDDNLIMFLIAKDHPLFGVGIATNTDEIWNTYYNNYSFLRAFEAYQNARSSGLANYVAGGGIPFIIAYVFNYVKYLVNMICVENKMQKMILLIIIILIFIEEPYMAAPFFYMGFFRKR